MPDTIKLVVDFGRHKGRQWTEVPTEYLEWMVTSGHSASKRARLELESRGAQLGRVIVTRYAIDRASTRILDRFSARDDDKLGICAWLDVEAGKALELGDVIDGEQGKTKVVYEGVFWIFDLEGDMPSLVSVIGPKNTKEVALEPQE